MFAECYSLNVSELFERACKLFPDKEAIYDRSRRMTYRELHDESFALSAALADLGIKKGDRIACCLPNWHEFIVVYLAAAHLGAIMVPFNTRYREHEVEYILENSGAKVAFMTESFSGVPHLEQFSNAKKKIPTLERLITVRFETNEHDSYSKLIARGRNLPFAPEKIDRKEDVFTILYTSGTTGKPKGAMLTHANVVHTGTITAEALQCTPDDVFLVAVPVFHVFGMVPSIATTFSVGGKMVLMDTYKAVEALQLIQDEKISVKHGVPSMFILELNHPDFNKFDLSSLRTGIIAAAPCPIEVVKRIRSDMGCNICISYGLTETSATMVITSFDDDDTIRTETVGRALPGAQVKIVGKNRETLPHGEIGEIACKSFGVMKGYWNMPEQTKAAFDEEGWFYTGDLGTLDEKGYVRIVGRAKEMIIRGGYNIYPREIEELIFTFPGVMEAAVVGLPDSVLGEISCAAIRVKPGETVDLEELKKFLQSKIADYKVPDKYIIVDEFPLTASGKLKKIELQEQLKIKLGDELR